MYPDASVLDEVVEEDLLRSPAVTVAVQRREKVYSDESASRRHPLALAVKRPGYVVIKTAGDWLIALTLLVLTAPLMIVLAAMVKLTSRGPVFYAQTRLGRYGKLYQMYKLRTMVHNAEAGTGPVWAMRNDSRITRVGKVLRRTHLDELPQLWNILKGEMSLIGPRPERPEIAARIEQQLPTFFQRLALRPGVTGLAQMRLPADNPDDLGMDNVRRKLAHDLFYTREVNFLLDLQIAISTPCYFLAASIGALHRILVRSSGTAAEEQFALAQSEAENGRAA